MNIYISLKNMVKQDLFIEIVAVVIVITLSIVVILRPSQEKSFQKENDERLKEIDLSNNQLLEVCNWDVPRGIAVELCDRQMKRARDNFCQDFKENLSNCSKIETYLQSRDL